VQLVKQLFFMQEIQGSPHGISEASFRTYGLDFGDVLTETVYLYKGALLQWEPHYFKLMASMRMLRLKIPATFSPEYLQEQITDTANRKWGGDMPNFARVQIRVLRDRVPGKRLSGLESARYGFEAMESGEFFHKGLDTRETHVYTEHRLPGNLLTGLGLPQHAVYAIAEVFADENNWDDAILLNERKRVLGSIRGNLWLQVDPYTWKTPAYEEGCTRSVFREHFMNYLKGQPGLTVQEGEVSPFELNDIISLVVQEDPYRFHLVSQYKRKKYDTDETSQLLERYFDFAREEIRKGEESGA
jgi:branched-chain amino acid aminotransferase